MEMEVRYRVIKEHVRSYDEPLKLRAGERVTVGRHDTKSVSWLWCTNLLGIGGWVPESILGYRDASSAVVTANYNSIELTIASGELVVGCHSFEGWIWCKKGPNEEGWVPLENLLCVQVRLD